ncbi:SIMPL domain-containing protein [Mahella australiensis]|uniref:26 kDa periplasmic immunogenic protein n=1 Tax=Mahella australiensis (strain DSM 15567 / CIP 107919 / 50-1 BON) TaxID=697281 RepID=F3ZVL2_MAHA5|nr:SIMPL domain-containing protein [Mahella australiensis]AEE96374.1 protein of unknown function DUF541 [Mahella australiensis 50-1 BON]
MNNKFLAIATVAVAAVAIILAIGIFGISDGQEADKAKVMYAADDVKIDKSILTAAGEGKVMAKPDRATINMGVQIDDKDAKTAQTQNAQKMDAVVKKLKALGISDEDIKTSQYNVFPQYDYSEDKSTLRGYQVVNMVNVTIKDTAKLGDIIDQATQAGANRMDSIAFTISEPDKYYNEAIAKAIEQAKEKANVMANTAGVKIKATINVSETTAGYQPVYDMGGMEYAKDLATTAAAPTPIASGQLEVKANVVVTFEIQ